MSIKQNGGVFGRNPTFNDVTIEGDLIINGEVFTGLDFQGSWNASTNSPTLASSTGTNGEFYIVSVAGATNLNGITNWGIGDWAIFNGTAWQRVEGGADGNFNALTSNSLNVNGTATMDGLTVDGDSIFNRTEAGSTIAAFQLSGAPAGVIGSSSGNIFLGDGSRGIAVDGGTVYGTYSTGGTADGAQNLGSATKRWLDLYLSGGVYLGGTGAANKLDDYEAGTWTPAFGNFTTWTSPTFTATYTKVGRLVTVTLNQTGGTIAASAVSKNILNLPFAPTSSGVGSVSSSAVADYGVCITSSTALYFANIIPSETSLSVTITYET